MPGLRLGQPEGVRFCIFCGSLLKEQQAPGGGRRLMGRVRWLVLTITLLIAAGSVLFAFLARWYRAPSVTAFFPADTGWIVEVDLQRGLEIFNEMRKIRPVAQAVAELEKDWGLSFERDVVPWCGQMALCPSWGGDKRHEPQRAALVMEVRDWDRFLKCADIVKEKVIGSNSWKEETYQGITIQKWQTARQPPIGLAFLKTHAIAGIGKGAVENVVDTWLGRKPSLSQSLGWRLARARMGDGHLLKVYMNHNTPSEVRSLLLPPVPFDRTRTTVAQLPLDVALSLAVEEDRITVTYIAVPTSDEMQKKFQKWASRLPVAKGNFLSLLPENTVGVCYFNNLGEWWEMTIESLEELGADQVGIEEEEWEDFKTEIKPLSKIFKKLKGDCALAVTWDEQMGWGILFVGATEDEEEAKDSSLRLKDFVERTGEMTVEQKGDLFFVPELVDTEEPLFPLRFCWTTRDRWLVVSSHPDWLEKQRAKQESTLAETIRKTVFGASFDFRWLESFLKQAQKQVVSESEKERVRFLECLNLQGARLHAWTEWDSDGRWSAFNLELTGWNWKKAVEATVENFGEVAQQSREKALQAACMSNVKQLELAMLMYVQDYDEYFPLHTDWSNSLLPYLRNEKCFVCPARPQLKRGYAYNRRISGLPLARITYPDITVSLYESNKGGFNPSDSGQSWISGGVHSGGNVTGFVDGHVKWYPWWQKDQLRFRP